MQVQTEDFEAEEEKAVVLDNGTNLLKIGFSGESSGPRLVLPNIVGRPKEAGISAGMGQKSLYIGDEAQTRRGILNLSYPMERGMITSWDDMENVWVHGLFSELGIEPENHPILLTDTALNPETNRLKMAEIMFEKFNFHSVYIATQAVLSLYGGGAHTGLVIDSGEGTTHCVPIYEGYAISHSIERLDIGGRDVTEHLMKTLMKKQAEEGKGIKCVTSAEREIVRDIKETCGSVSLNQDNNNNSNNNVEYELPDGQTLSIGEERFECTEVMFNPELMGIDSKGIHKLVYDSIESCDLHLKKELYGNIVLSGGNTLFPNMKERIQMELKSLVPFNQDRIHVEAPNDRKYSVWIGGSILSSLPVFRELWIDKMEFSESKGNAILRKCF
ncbi:hypothetical protein RFI_15382 [Reticulomyxa filosa]|uniref:Actin n=1 Tax=Reticulomyxa filosa TaxID=46433 RepID=X6N716_RETFI|nr:hypothetical protein RFI_15382 [Reticulomyxa filosa]|eukprot:ETO21826.1 hypothetical protein RFI_15382 [Reticulomyxa filosa]